MINSSILMIYFFITILCILIAFMNRKLAVEVCLVVSMFLFWAALKLFWENFQLSFWGYSFLTKWELGDLINRFGYVTREPMIVHFGLDALSIYFVFLTLFIFPFCYYYLLTQNIEFFSPDLFALVVLLLEVVLLLTFSCLHLLVFYFFFESLLIPMYFIIILWSSSDWRKFKAGNYFFMYTTTFSSFMLYSCFYIYSKTHTLSIILFNERLQYETGFLANIAWFGLFVAFGSKVPIFPLHIWLPEAHVEAPTVGSVILASLLLKLGGYGLLRFVFPFFKFQTIQFAPVVLVFCSCGILYGALIACRQIDLKKIVAYSSIVHMNFALIGFFSWTVEGFVGGLTLMLAHGFVSAGLFFLIGMLYERLGSRLLNEFSGIVETMPLLAFFFFFYFLANLGFPMSINFVGEVLIFFSLYSSSYISPLVFFMCGFSFILNVIYCIWTFNRVCFGQLNWGLKIRSSLYDLSQREFILLMLLFTPVLFFGIRTNSILNYLDFYCSLTCL